MDNNTIEKVLCILKEEYKKWDAPIVTKIADRTKDPFRVLVSTVLSARTKDAVTSKASEKLFKKAIKLDKKFPLSYFNLMILYKQQNRIKEEQKLRKQAAKMKIILPEIKIMEKESK